MGTAEQIMQTDGAAMVHLDERIFGLIPSNRTPVVLQEEEHGFDAPTLPPVVQLVRRERIYRRWLAIADSFASILGVLFTVLIFGETPTLLVYLVPLLAVPMAKIEGLYDRDDQVIQKTNLAEWRTLLQSNLLVGIGLYLAWRVVTHSSPGGMRLFGTLVLTSFLFSLIGRGVARRFARAISPPERCVIVGDPARVGAVRQRLEALDGVELVGLVSEFALTGSVSELQTVVEDLGLHRLIIAHAHEPNDSTLHLIQAAKFLGVRVSLVPSVMTAVGGFAIIEEVDGLTLLGVPRFGLSASSALIKRAFDIVIGLLAILCLWPLMLLIAVAIKLDSRGPILFRQTRVGRGGRPFHILKFRSMVDGADSMKTALLHQNEAGDGLFKMANDPRITRVGRTIRATHLDEMPQLVNVLFGEMSLVGPRPLVLEEDERVKGRDRHRVHLTPGITGPWQIKGPLHTPLSEMAKLDYRYASAWSIWEDLDILIRTVVRIASRSGH